VHYGEKSTSESAGPAIDSDSFAKGDMVPHCIKRYGWIPDRPDHRDRRLLVEAPAAGGPLPASVDLRAQCPPVYDPGQLGSCTANAIAGALEFDTLRQGQDSVMPSRLFIYWNERYIENTTASDSGAQIRDGIKSVAQWGDCPETEWPYDVSQFAVQPTPACYADAKKHLALVYEAVDQDLDHMRGCLAAGFPFVFGFTVYASFESQQVAQTGVVPMPQWFERALGGHAVMCVGYDDASQLFTVRNSWGVGWGQSGYCQMPYQYLAGQLASDFWTIRTVQ
jgi:C1A family cysteine protease